MAGKAQACTLIEATLGLIFWYLKDSSANDDLYFRFIGVFFNFVKMSFTTNNQSESGHYEESIIIQENSDDSLISIQYCSQWQYTPKQIS